MINALVTKHFKILRRSSILGVRIVESVDHTDSFNRLLGDAIELRRRFDSNDFENRGGNVDHVMKLISNLAAGFDPFGPGDGQAVASAAEMAGDLLGPLKRRIHGMRPGRREMVVMFITAERVERASFISIGSGMALKNVISLSKPFSPPSALEPLSPAM